MDTLNRSEISSWQSSEAVPDTTLVNELALHIQLVIFAACLSAIGLWLARRLNFFVWKLHPPTPLSFKIVGQVFALFLTFQLILMPLAVGLIFFISGNKLVLSSEMQGWFSLGAIAVVGFVLILYSYLHWAELLPLFKSSNIASDLSLGFSAWLIAYPLMLVVAQILTILLSDIGGYVLTDQLAVKQIKNTLEYPSLFFWMVVAVTLVVPIMEEFLFRGVLQSALRQHFKACPAILLTSLLFTFFHFSFEQGVNNITILCSLYILSLFLGFLRERQGNLWGSIGLHITFNAVSVLMILTQS